MADGTLKVGTITTSSGSGTITIGQSGETVTVTNGIMSGHMYPAFEAYLSANQSINDITDTKVQFNTEVFDTDNCYDNSTNYRFTPTVAGKYFVYSIVTGKDLGNDLLRVDTRIYKNGGGLYSNIIYVNTNSAGNMFGTPVYGIVDMNGSTDYLEIFAYLDYVGSSGVVDGSGDRVTYFGAYRIGS